jgi:hypothetical protein
MAENENTENNDPLLKQFLKMCDEWEGSFDSLAEHAKLMAETELAAWNELRQEITDWNLDAEPRFKKLYDERQEVINRILHKIAVLPKRINDSFEKSKERTYKIQRLLHDSNDLGAFAKGFNAITNEAPLTTMDILHIYSQTDGEITDKAKAMLVSERKQQAQYMLDIQHEHSRKEKAEAIDYYRQHPELSQAKCIDYLREHFPNGLKRPGQLSHSKVKGWLNGSRKK